MAESDKILSELVQLISLYTEGELDCQQGARLEEMLYDPDVRKLYFDIMDINLGLEYLGDSFEILNQDLRNNLDPSILNALAEYEKLAPSIPSIPEPANVQNIDIDVCVPVNQKISKTKVIATSVLSLAAILIFAITISFSVFQNETQVATVTDLMEAQWADNTSPLERGEFLASGQESYSIEHGLVEIRFNDGANVVVEAPAKFQILAEDRIGIEFGKIYSRVPREAIGFSVYTKNAKIIDMGTEFGVQADIWGDTYLHVVKGKTALIAGSEANKSIINVVKGDAKKISADNTEVRDVIYDDKLFVRKFDSRENFVWRGKNQIKLADIVGGGSGFGGGKPNVGIDPTTGKAEYLSFNGIKETNEFRFVSHNSFIDGVFIPNGNTSQIVSSYGHVFEDCPVSSGRAYSGVINTPQSSEFAKLLKYETVSNDSDSYILMHANLGITFDLEAIRSYVTGAEIIRFKSDFGLIGKPIRLLNADFWVLVDGKLKYHQTGVKELGVNGHVEVDIAEGDRFLTLMVTDGGDPEGRKYGDKTLSPIDMDWGVFDQPELILE